MIVPTAGMAKEKIVTPNSFQTEHGIARRNKLPSFLYCKELLACSCVGIVDDNLEKGRLDRLQQYAQSTMKKRQRVLLSFIPMIIGGILMRFSWLFIHKPFSPYTMVLGALLSLVGVVWFSLTLFSHNRRF